MVIYKKKKAASTSIKKYQKYPLIVEARLTSAQLFLSSVSLTLLQFSPGKKKQKSNHHHHLVIELPVFSPL